MNVTDLTLYSELADRDFDLAVYGDAGRAVIVLPEGDSTCSGWENHGMVAALSDLIEDGAIQLFCVDSLDACGWHARGAFSDYRLDNIEAYVAFVAGELAPYVAQASKDEAKPLVVGAGIGALNAMLALLAKPDNFGGLLALSGTYDVRAFVGPHELEREFAERWLALSPIDVLAGLSARTKAVRALKSLPVAFVCGRDASETGVDSQRALEELLAQKKVAPTFEYWGYDVSHDWYWWQTEAAQMLPCLLEDRGLKRREQVAAQAQAQSDADHAQDVLSAAQAELKDAEKNLADLQQAAANAVARVESEEAQLEVATKTAADLAEVAHKAWAERDRIQAELDQALAAARQAQTEANAAVQARSEAEWILGEARAQSADAQDGVARAEARLADATNAVANAEQASADAAAALAKAKKTRK